MKKLLTLLLLIGAGITGGMVWHSYQKSPTENGDGFKLEPVQKGSITESVSATGHCKPREIIAVGSPQSGRVVHLYPNADLNRVVEEDEPLLQLDATFAQQKVQEADAAVTAAEAKLASARFGRSRAEAGRQAAQLKVERYTELVKSNLGMRRELDEAAIQLLQAHAGIEEAKASIKAAESDIERAKVAREQARLGLTLMTVKVPARTVPEGQSAGPKRRYTVIDRQVVLGQLIGPPASAQLFTLASDLSEMQVHTQVAEGDITQIKLGLEATFSVQGYPEDSDRFRGQVSQIRPVPTNTAGAVFYTVILDVPNTRDKSTNEWRLRPGMTAAVDIALREHRETWKVPTRALGFQPDEAYLTAAAQKKKKEWEGKEGWKAVWVVDPNQKDKLQPVFVRIGGKNAQGEAGFKDVQFNEALEWEPELKQPPEKLELVVDAPPVPKSGIFGGRQPLKLF